MKFILPFFSKKYKYICTSKQVLHDVEEGSDTSIEEVISNQSKNRVLRVGNSPRDIRLFYHAIIKGLEDATLHDFSIAAQENGVLSVAKIARLDFNFEEDQFLTIYCSYIDSNGESVQPVYILSKLQYESFTGEEFSMNKINSIYHTTP